MQEVWVRSTRTLVSCRTSLYHIVEKTNNEKRLLRAAVADLFPGYFALVMATGITSIAANLLGMIWVAVALLYVNIAAFVVLWAMLLARLAFFFKKALADLNDHVRGPGFFTVVAGTCVFGSQLVLVADNFQIAGVLWIVGLICWVVIMYAFFTAVTVRMNKPPLEKGISGSWLIAVVATQSVSVLGTILAAHYTQYSELLLFFTLCMYLIGCMLYIILITLIFYRFTFLDITREVLTPPYWINMGAVAITTLAGARLILAAQSWSLINEIGPFLKGFTLFFWSAGTWWIPLLFILGFWRHAVKKFPIRYDPQFWGMVFPLGMYTACTFQLSNALGFSQLMVISNIFIYLALAAWIITFGAMLYTFIRKREAHAE
jgi:tellurite resistance protein TehA-like permease